MKRVTEKKKNGFFKQLLFFIALFVAVIGLYGLFAKGSIVGVVFIMVATLIGYLASLMPAKTYYE